MDLYVEMTFPNILLGSVSPANTLELNIKTITNRIDGVLIIVIFILDSKLTKLSRASTDETQEQ